MSGQAFAIHCRLRRGAPVIARPQQRRARCGYDSSPRCACIAGT